MIKNKRKCVLYIAVSLDGYIADINGNVDWLGEVKGDGKDNGYLEFIKTIDTVLIGRKSYEKILTFGDWCYTGLNCYVFSQSMKGKTENVEFINIHTKEFLNNLREKGGKNIWLLGGSDLIDEFIKQNLIDEFIISIIPTILGDGIPLFKNRIPKTQLDLLETTHFGDIVQMRYIKKY